MLICGVTTRMSPALTMLILRAVFLHFVLQRITTAKVQMFYLLMARCDGIQLRNSRI